MTGVQTKAALERLGNDDLACVERAFRQLKTRDPQLLPSHLRKPERDVQESPVRAAGRGAANETMRQIRSTAEGGWVWNFLGLLNEMRPPMRNRMRFPVPDDRRRGCILGPAHWTSA